MVANMAISHLMKQPRHSSPRKGGAADPDQKLYGWPFKADTLAAGSGDKPDKAGMIPSPDGSSNSWETRAFAEDASSLAAGIWPPRAYPCSFCRREFRSAQALGGHMNVHRRDRARLRHSSPPLQVPLCAAPLMSSSLFKSQQYGVNASARCPNESLIQLNTALSKSAILPPSFPLRLQQLASEAAASFMFAQARESSDLLSLSPPSRHTNIRATPTKERANEFSLSSSPPVSSIGSPSTTDATPCRRVAPIIRPEDESPKKKSHTETGDYTHSYGYIMKATNPSIHGLHAQDIQLPSAEETSYSERRREACGGGGEVDLELRLGQRPP